MYEKYYRLNKSFIQTIDSVSQSSPKEISRIFKYLEWIPVQNGLFVEETRLLNIPDKLFKTVITIFEFNCHQKILSKYYYLRSSHGDYVRNNSPMNQSDKEYLLKNMVLIKKKVVWIEFGFNMYDTIWL